MDEDNFFDVVIEKALLGFLTTAIVAVLTLSAVPKVDLDVNLHAAAQRYFWSIAFLGGYFIVRSFGRGPMGLFAESWSTRVAIMVWFAGGTITWAIGTQALVAHFGIPDWEGVATLVVFLVPMHVIAVPIFRNYLRRKSVNDSLDSQ